MSDAREIIASILACHIHPDSMRPVADEIISALGEDGLAIVPKSAHETLEACGQALDMFADEPVSTRKRMTLREEILLAARDKVHAYLRKHNPMQAPLEEKTP